MASVEIGSLAQVFSQVQDGRDPRGVRHPLPALLTLVFLGLLARIRQFAVLQRWIETHWNELREPLGFTHENRPHATTFSRALSKCSVADFSAAFIDWLCQQLPPNQPLTMAVDAKTSCQGLDAEGHPIQMLTAFVHDLQWVIGQWSVTGEKTNEPEALRRHLPELLEKFPLLRLMTGDAIYAQRPLAEALMDENCDYLVQIKANQKDVRDALETCLGAAHQCPPAAESVEKKGRPSIVDGCGSTWRISSTFVIPYRIPGQKSGCVLIGT